MMNAAIRVTSRTKVLLAAALLLAGCASSAQRPAARRSVNLAEFAAPVEARAPVVAADPGAQGAPEAAEALKDTAGGEGVRAGHRPSEDAASGEARPQILRRPGDSVIVEGLVGQINGRPIFADAFFEPMEDRILAARGKRTAQDFKMTLTMSITQHLRDVVNDELFIADAESQLTPEQQKGVFAILRDMQEFTIAEKGGGTRKAAETKVLEEEGRTLDEYLRDRKDKAFIQTSLLRKIAPRVIVSWRDVEREYRHRYVEFNPPQTVTLARISVPTDEGPEQINEIESRLSSGESFADVAESLGIPDGGRLSPKTMGPGGISDISFDDAIKAQVARLQPGQHSPPFQMGDSTWWIAVVSIDTPPHRDIHDADVQRMLTDSIHRERELAEIERYAAMLRQRWVADDLEAMRLRLLAIANDRYLR